MALTVMNDFDRLFAEPFFLTPTLSRSWTADPFFANAQKQLQTLSPAVNVKETPTSFVIDAAIPGVPKENVNVELKDGILTLSGEQKTEKKEDKDKWHCVERSYGKFQRSFRVPEGVTAEQIHAKYENGVLQITMPNVKGTPKQEQKKITVN